MAAQRSESEDDNQHRPTADRELATADAGAGGSTPETPAPAPAARPSRTCSIVIPVHNKASLTRQCLNTLLAQSEPGIERDIVVVDDGSTDLTPRLLAAYTGRLRAVRHERPTGFAIACNAGAAYASGEYLIFLNNDTLPRAGWLAALVNHAEAHPAAAVVGSKLLYPNDTIQHAGVVFGHDRYPHHLYTGFPANHPAANKSRRFQVVTAACCLIRRDAFEQAGGFDTAFLNGWEDVDLCLRLGELGYEVHYCANSVVHHLESASRDPRLPQERENRERYAERWRHRVEADALEVYADDGLLTVNFTGRYPIRISASPLLASLEVGDAERLADRLLQERARHVSILLRNNIILNLRVQEAELKTQAAELRARQAEQRATASEGRALAAESRGVLPAPAADPGSDTPAEVPPPEPPPAGSPEPAAAGGSPERTTPRPPRTAILGSVERPGREPEVVGPSSFVVSGWALSKAGIYGIQTLVDGSPRGEIEYGEWERPDVSGLHPDIEGAERCGFYGRVPTEGLTAGQHGLVIRVIAKDGRHVELPTTFEFDPTLKSSGRILAAFDRPAPRTRPVVRDRLLITGWALSPSGIRAVETLVDGEPLGHVAYGALRPDVGSTHADYPAADHSGFTGSVSVADLPDGEHELVVRLTANDDQTHDVATPFVVDTSGTDIGEVPLVNRQYPRWLEAHAPTPGEVDRPPADESASAQAGLSLIVPVGDASPAVLTAMVDRLLAQVVEGWQLCLAIDDTSTEDLHALVRRFTANDPRIVATALPGAAGPTKLVNAALAKATGEYVAVVELGTNLPPLALSSVVRFLDTSPESDIVYGDEDKVDPETGVAWDPFFKPDWSPSLLLSTDHFGPLTFYRRSLLVSLDGLRAVAAPAYDLALRATERTDRVGHLTAVIASRPLPMANGLIAKSDSLLAGERAALTDALVRREQAGTVEPGIAPGRWRVRFDLPERPGVTVVLPTGGKLQFLRPCLQDLLERTTYPNLRILIVDNSDGVEVASLSKAFAHRHPHLRYERLGLKPFNFSAIVNHGVALVDTPYLILLNDDITVVTPDWIDAMLEQARQPDVGVVGAKLLYSDDTFQHAGVILGPYQGSGHAFKQFAADVSGYFGLPNVVRDYSAVTFACAMMRKEVYDAVGGLDAHRHPIAFNDVDLCLRVREQGLRVVYTPHAVLYHHESVTKTVIADPSEIGHLRTRWGHVIDRDPFYHPNLTRRAEDFSLDMSAVDPEP